MKTIRMWNRDEVNIRYAEITEPYGGKYTLFVACPLDDKCRNIETERCIGCKNNWAHSEIARFVPKDRK